MKRALIAVAVLAAAVAPTAAGKGVISRVELCGAQGCEAIAIPQGVHEWPGSAGPAADPPPVSPFFEVRVTIAGLHRQSLWYVPAQRRFAWEQHDGSARWSGIWQRIDEIIARAAGTREPHRARVVSASVDGRRIAGDASGYVELFRLGRTVGRAGTSWVEVRLKTAPPSPWSLDRLWFYPQTGVLQRGTELVKLPPSVAADLRAARSIDRKKGSGFDWPLVTGSLGVAFGLALSAGVAVRRRPRPEV